MKYTILIDATTVVSKKDGLSQYIIALLNNLPADAFEKYNMEVLVNKGLQRDEFWEVIRRRNYIVREVKIAPIGPRRDIDMLLYLFRYSNTFDLFHSTSNQYPPFLKKGIATIHDITFRKYLNSGSVTYKFARFFLDNVIRRSIKNAAAVIAVSNFTRQELISNYAVARHNENKITVIYEGWEHLDELVEPSSQDESAIQYSEFLFYVGTTRVHKNIKGLLLAYKLALPSLSPGVKLVITGNETYLDDESRLLISEINAIANRVLFTGFVSNLRLSSLFKNADAFVFPSLSEGFGIPVLEAFYFNCPLLCSSTTSLPEIAGDAAIYFNPEDPEDIARAIIHFYSDKNIAEKLKMLGKKRLELFSWKKTGVQTMELYRSALEKLK